MKLDFKKLAKKEWYIEHVDACPAFLEMTGSGFTKNYSNKIPVYSMNIVFCKDYQVDWMSLLTDHERVGGTLVRSFMADRKELGSLHDKWEKNFHKLLKFYYQNFSNDFSVLNDKELLEKAEEIYHEYNEYRKLAFPGFIDGFMFYADKRFDFLIKEFCRKESIENYAEIFSVLSAPIKPSFINEEENDLKKIKNKNSINNHLSKYSWIKSSYAGYVEYSLEDLQKELRKIKKEKKIKNFRKELEKNKKEKAKLFKKYDFTPEILAIIRLTEILVKWQDERKIYTLTFVSLQEKILKEIGKRTGIGVKLLYYCTLKDIPRVLKGQFFAKELEARRKSTLIIYRNGKMEAIFTGKRAVDFYKKASAVKIGNLSEIRGMTASLGKVIGKVKIIMSAKNIHKVQKGDILVAPMTRPEHLLGMKKAAAIVTDDGGITSHAAIIARELGIPCIIGTLIATKVLKDGDLVEVDANKGIVKIIKK